MEESNHGNYSSNGERNSEKQLAPVVMDCKKALNETNGDMEKAVEFLREKGLAAMAKKANRIAAEGIVAIKACDCGKAAAIVEVNSETDFVAKMQISRLMFAKVAAQALDTKAETLEAFMAEHGLRIHL